MPKNRKLQNIIGTEHITDAAEAAIAAQASGGATVAFKNVAVSGQDTVVADAATDTLNIAGAGSVSVTTNASTDTLTITGTDTNTQLSTEQVQDIVGAMFTGNTETNITATYQDSDGTIDLVASGGGGGSSYPQFATVSGTGNDYFITCALPPISYNILSFTTVTLSDDIIFSPIIMLADTTVTELGARANSGTGDFVAAIYDSDSTNNLPQNKVANSDVTFTSPASGFNSASFSSPITLSANELYWAAVCNSSTGVNTILTSGSSSGQMTTTDGSSFNRGSLRIISGTINSLPSSITQSDVTPQYSTPFIWLKEQ